MSKTESFETLFNTLTPIQHNSDRHEDDAKRGACFSVKLIHDVPYLVVAKGIDTTRLRSRETTVLREILKTAEEESVFSIDWTDEEITKASIRQNPYLLHLIKDNVEVMAPDGHPIEFNDEEGIIILKIQGDANAPVLHVNLTLRENGDERAGVVFLDDSHVIVGHNVYPIKPVGLNFPKITGLITDIPPEMLQTYLTLFLSYVDNILPEWNGVAACVGRHPEHAVAMIYLEKVAPDKALYLRTGISLDSIDTPLPPGFIPTRTVMQDDKNLLTVRDVVGCDIEKKTDRLEHAILSAAPDRYARKEVYREHNFFIIPEHTAGPFLLNYLPEVLEEFRMAGSEKLKEYKITATPPKLNMKFSSGIDFLEGEGDIVIGEDHFTIADLLSQYAKRRYVKLSDGNRCIIEENYINRLKRLFHNRDRKGRIKVTLFDMPEVEELINTQIKGDFAAKTRKVFEGFNRLQKARLPKMTVNASLRPYQKEGVKWLKYLYDNSLGGCLADDMGLGKTLQTIALLSLIYPSEKRPTLVVMPRSLLFNWEKELDRFAPHITHSTYYGPDRNLDAVLNDNVILTTYAIVRNDAMKLKEIDFASIVLDESQNIKNLAAQTTIAVQLLHSDHRFALSGTPMENNLTELYSLFRFLNPTMFGSADDFNKSYTVPIQKYGDKDATESLRRRIFPFILRRLKKDVLDELPPRIDQTIYVEMSEAQKRLYNERRLAYRQQISETISREGIEKTQFLMFQALSELRRIASVPESFGGGNITSPKIDELLESLTSAVSNRHKSVVFFNFIAGLELVMSKLERLGIDFECMTGSTSVKGRKQAVERFQSDPDCMVMLLTLKVGGVGLNLTAADTVYIVEPWWNKAAEEQAINRLHRIGQKKTVSAFSLITVGTIEEKILQLQEMKSELFNELISADSVASKHLSEKDIDFILS